MSLIKIQDAETIKTLIIKLEILSDLGFSSKFMVSRLREKFKCNLIELVTIQAIKTTRTLTFKLGNIFLYNCLFQIHGTKTTRKV